MPNMTDVRAGAVFRFVGGDQFFGAANATYSKRGTPIGDHRRHNNSIPIPDRIVANTTFNSAASLFLSGAVNSSLHCITKKPKQTRLLENRFTTVWRFDDQETQLIVCCTAMSKDW
jgi:hypothetical protein